jgi:hypothetical protein
MVHDANSNQTSAAQQLLYSKQLITVREERGGQISTLAVELDKEGLSFKVS